ncbi:MAG: DciA family protein [Planctomycetota bacterium]
MDPHDTLAQRRLDGLRSRRNYPDADRSMGFVKKMFQRSIADPHRRLGRAAAAWEAAVPEALRPQTRLVSLQRGVLRVEVDSSATLYELDAVLRAGLERSMQAAKVGVRRVRLAVGQSGGG